MFGFVSIGECAAGILVGSVAAGCGKGSEGSSGGEGDWSAGASIASAWRSVGEGSVAGASAGGGGAGSTGDAQGEAGVGSASACDTNCKATTISPSGRGGVARSISTSAKSSTAICTNSEAVTAPVRRPLAPVGSDRPNRAKARSISPSSPFFRGLAVPVRVVVTIRTQLEATQVVPYARAVRVVVGPKAWRRDTSGP